MVEDWLDLFPTFFYIVPGPKGPDYSGGKEVQTYLRLQKMHYHFSSKAGREERSTHNRGGSWETPRHRIVAPLVESPCGSAASSPCPTPRILVAVLHRYVPILTHSTTIQFQLQVYNGDTFRRASGIVRLGRYGHLTLCCFSARHSPGSDAPSGVSTADTVLQARSDLAARDETQDPDRVANSLGPSKRSGTMTTEIKVVANINV